MGFTQQVKVKVKVKGRLRTEFKKPPCHGMVSLRELIRLKNFNNFTINNQAHYISHPLYLFDAMRNHDECHALILVQLHEGTFNIFCGYWI